MQVNESDATAKGALEPWDNGSHDAFFSYYEKQSQSAGAIARFRAIQQTLLRLLGEAGRQGPFDVLDVGCGAGAQSNLWLEHGHRYQGLDINRPLIQLARQRARQQALQAEFHVGSATELPLPDGSVDICLSPFLLEHVVSWQLALDEAVRVLRPGGLLFVSTTSKLCPVQDEFQLPGYGWYPAPLKRYVERRSVTDWPAVANHAKYPAVNWFSVYQLGRYFRARKLDVFDRFDLIDPVGKGAMARFALAALRRLPPVRFLGHVLTPYTVIVARKT